MNMLQELKTLGVDTEDAINRMNGNISLYERMLIKFVDMMRNLSVRQDFDCKDYASAVESAHAIKGVSGNLSITPVYKAYSEIVRLLRADMPEQAEQILEKVMPVQTEIITCIEKYAR